MNYFFVYVTTSSKEEAIHIGKAAVEKNLAACANVFGTSESIFQWEKDIEIKTETVMILKTSGRVVTKLVDFVTDQHSYQCPCVVSIEVAAGNQGFLDWIANQTQNSN